MWHVKSLGASDDEESGDEAMMDVKYEVRRCCSEMVGIVQKIARWWIVMHWWMKQWWMVKRWMDSEAKWWMVK